MDMGIKKLISAPVSIFNKCLHQIYVESCKNCFIAGLCAAKNKVIYPVNYVSRWIECIIRDNSRATFKIPSVRLNIAIYTIMYTANDVRIITAEPILKFVCGIQLLAAYSNIKSS